MVLAESRSKPVGDVEPGSIVIVGRAPTFPCPTNSGFPGSMCSLELRGVGEEAYC